MTQQDPLYPSEANHSDAPSLTDYVRAVVNILEDFGDEKQRLETTQKAVLNILEDLEDEKQSAQEANRMKSEFLANMSHELRTPLNSIIGFSELMSDGKVGPIADNHKEYLGDILTSARHLLQLINDVLDLAKVEAGKLEFDAKPIDLHSLIFGIRDTLRSIAASRNIQVEVKVDKKFTTIGKPNSATIAADKMNVVYRGVANPMTITFAGIDSKNINASAAGLSKKSGSAYTLSPGTGREVTINVSGKLPNGGGTVTDNATFRIKDIPRPTGTIRGEDGDGACVKMQRAGLERSSIGAELLDFDFDLKLNVSGFSFKVSGQPTVRVNGTKLDGAAKGSLKRAKRGETVQIFDIQAKISGNSGYRLRKISPICIELTN